MSAPSLLLVDDEVEFVETLAERLELRGHSAAVVHNGMDALAFLEKNQVDAVVRDMVMPGLSGRETLQRIRKNRPNLPVVLLSGNVAEDEEEAFPGPSAALHKPVNLERLLETLRALIGR